jgi:hypothetical protein
MVTITVEQKVKLTAAPTSQSGNPADVEPGSYRWLVSPFSPEGLVTLEPVGDGRECYVVPTAVGVGLVLIVCQADADLGAGVETIAGNFEVNVVGAKAATVGITAGAPEPR